MDDFRSPAWQEYKDALVAVAEATMRLDAARMNGGGDVARAERELEEAVQACDAIMVRIRAERA